MCLLLPPSEAKSSGGRGRPLGHAAAGGSLGSARQRVLEALAVTIGLDRASAANALHLPAGLAQEALDANGRVLDSPTTPALRRYCGTVYEGLSFDRLSPSAQRLAGRATFIFSGLWGVVRGDERVPLYRLPAKAVLPGVGVAATYWRPILDEAMPRLLGHALIIDLRSTDYAAMWRPRGSFATRTVTVRVLSPLPRGGHGVISYASKLAKGQLCAAVLEALAGGTEIAGGPTGGVDLVVEAWRARGGAHFEVGGPGHVDLYTG